MDRATILYPVFAQLFITMGLYIYLAIEKSKAVKLGKVNEARRNLYDDAWPEKVLQINNCIRNQFELPVLFYVLAFILFLLDSVSLVTVILAWLFIVSRILHAFIHTGSNYVPFRKKIFMSSFLIISIISIITLLNI